MIYQIFTLFLLLGFCLVALGSYNKEIVLEILGFLLIFLMGVTLMSTGIEYTIGESINETYKYGDNYTGYHWDYDTNPNPSKTDINLFHKTVTNSYTYETYKSHLIGFYLAVISALGFAYCWFSYKPKEGD